MTPDVAEEIVKQARDRLAEIAAVQADMRNRVQVAYRLGIGKSEIARLSGLARTTVDRYVGHQS